MKIRFILNPIAGRGRREARLSQTRYYFEKKLGHFGLVMTKNHEDAAYQTRIALHEGFEQIVVLGGDGTLNAVVNGFFENGRLINPEARLVISNWGTGSDYYKTIVAGSYVSDWKTLVTEHKVCHVDIGEIQFQDQKKVFVNLASVGLSAAAAKMKNDNSRWMPRALSYILPAMGALVKYSAVHTQITRDSETLTSNMMALFVGKGLYAGGGMKLGGRVSLDDGFFDVKLFEKMSIPVAVRRLPRLYSGHFEGIEEIKSFRAREIRVECDKRLPVESDGEIYGTTDVVFRIQSKALPVCLPRD